MRNLWRIVRFTGELWPYYVGVSAFTILVAGMSQLMPLFTKGAIDEVTKIAAGGQADVGKVVIFAVLIFASDVGQTVFSYFGGYLGDMLSARLNQLMSNRYFAHLLELPQAYFDRELSGRTLNRMNRGINQITRFAQAFANNFLQFIFSTVFSLVIVAYYSWQVAVMLFIIYPIFIWLTGLTSKKWQRLQHTINDEMDQATGRFAEVISQIKVVKSYRQQQRELNIFGRHYNVMVGTTRPQSRYWHQQDTIRRLVLNAIFLAIFVYIFVETARGAYSIGTMVLLIQYAMLVRIPIFSISFIVDQSQRAVANTKDYFEVMDEQPEITDQPGAEPIVISQGEVKFEDVEFAYGKGKPVLRGLNFTLQPNSKTAIVGESGEGKTTVTSLLLRLYEVSGGAITIDGQNINDVTQASLHESIGIVFQDPALFSGTIRENIAYARPKASQADIEAAARAANAHEFISKFEKGYDSEIGERGLKLSGGQKQRIAIARALLKNAPILILDEATSSLDTKSERQVQQALEHLMRGRTTLIIAHRLSTIQTVDTIVTLQNGKADEVGSPHELAKTKGIYAELLKLQQGHTKAGEEKLKHYGIKE